MPAAHFKLFTPAKPRRFSPFRAVSGTPSHPVSGSFGHPKPPRFGQFRAASGSFGQLRAVSGSFGNSRQLQAVPNRSGMVPAWFRHGSGMVLAPPQLKHKKDKNHAQAELEKPNKAELKSPQPMILVFLP